MQKEYLGGAVGASLAAAITSTDTSIQVNQANGWPAGPLPFVALITNGTIQEKVLCSSRSGTVLAVQQRGYDGTVAQDWSIGAQVVHVLDALAASEFSAHVSSTDGHFSNILTTDAFAPTDSGDLYPFGISFFPTSSSTGWPLTNAGFAINYKNASGRFMQEWHMWYDVNAESRFQRYWHPTSGGWTSWKQVATREWANTMGKITQSADFTVLPEYMGKMIYVNTTSGPTTITVPSLSVLEGSVFSILKDGTNLLTVNFSGSSARLPGGDGTQQLTFTMSERYTTATLWNLTTDIWIVSGAID